MRRKPTPDIPLEFTPEEIERLFLRSGLSSYAEMARVLGIHPNTLRNWRLHGVEPQGLSLIVLREFAKRYPPPPTDEPPEE